MLNKDDPVSEKTNTALGSDKTSSLGSQRRGSWLRGLYSSFTDKTEAYGINRVYDNKNAGDSDGTVYDVDDIFTDTDCAFGGRRRERTLSEPSHINAADFVRECEPNADNKVQEQSSDLSNFSSSPSETAFARSRIINRRGSFPISLSSLLSPKLDHSDDMAASDTIETENTNTELNMPGRQRQRSGSLPYFSRFYQTNDRLATPIEAHEEDPDGLETGELIHFLSTAGRGL